MRLVFLGSPQAGAPSLSALVESGHDIALVVSAPDSKRGRGNSKSPCPVRLKALELGLATTDNIDDILALDPKPDLGVVVAFGQLIRQPLLDYLDFVNIHFSLLPRWRGAAPVERAILAGDTTSGVCLMQIEAGLDTGGTYRVEQVEIGPSETSQELTHRLSLLGAQMLVEAFASPSDGKQGPSDGKQGSGASQQGGGDKLGVVDLGECSAQTGDPTWAEKIQASDCFIRWDASSTEIVNQLRIGPGITVFRDKRFKIMAATPVEYDNDQGHCVGTILATKSQVLVLTSNAALVLETVQSEGKAPMSAVAWANGTKPNQGEAFTSLETTQ